MRKIYYPTMLIASFMFLISCSDKVEESWEVNTPVYLSYDELRSSFKVAEGQEIMQSGKIYFKDHYIFVNEYQKGIHVIDNEDPTNPQIIKFIEIPGNVDMAIAGNILYADSYVDLLSIDISDIGNITIVDRDTNIFPYVIPEAEVGIFEPIDETQGVIVGYEVTRHTEEVKSYTPDYMRFPMWESSFMSADIAVMSNAPGTGGEVNFGTGGSMARFTLVDGYLYAIDEFELKLIDITTLNNPAYERSISLGWGIETIFPYNEKIFIGSQTGMIIYDIANTSNPVYISEFRHASACDPVVVEGNYAYVTLRGGNLCGAISSQLNVIDISNIASPVLLETYPMTEPYGLGIDKDVLFVCDGKAGLKIYDAKDPMKIAENKLAHYDSINAFDVIPLGDVLLMIGIDGLYQYEYSDIDSIKQLSYVPVYGESEN